MADVTSATKRNSNGTNKSRKSKNEIIRSTVGAYLKQRNYSMSEKFRKSDLVSTQTINQAKFNMMLENDLSKADSFIYSNVLCLNKNSTIVDQQFAKFLHFVQSQQSLTIKTELSQLINPLLCHLYIELLKGKDSQPAIDLLRKYAYIIAPVDNTAAPLASKINGTSVSASIIDDFGGGADGIPQPSSTTQITFITNDLENNTEQNSKEYFKELVQLMSMCLHIEELDSMEITRNFRYSKYEIELSVNSLYALKHFLVKNGHVIILHILQTWFTVDINTSVQSSTTGSSSSDRQKNINKMLVNNPNNSDDIVIKTESKKNDSVINDFLNRPIKNCEILPTTKIKEEILDCPTATTITTTTNPINEQQIFINEKLRYLRNTISQLDKDEAPIRVFNVTNTDNARLCCADLDPNECHIACGFDISTVRVWQLHKSNIRGRKPYRSKSFCNWDTVNKFIDSSDDDEDEEDDDDGGNKMGDEKNDDKSIGFKTIKNNSKTTTKYLASENGDILLRGHSKGVTDVLFSKRNPLLVTVSKDKTMRAWHSSNYNCAAIYTGHNYPIWCVAESSVGLFYATGSRDHTARLWSTDRNFPLQTYIGHTQDVDDVAFHPNGNYLATASTDLTVRLWCVTSGKLLRVFTDSHLPVQCVSFSPDGKLLAAGGEESKVRIFDLAAGQQLSELKDHSAPVTSLTWNALGTKIASCCTDGTVRVFNLNKQQNNSVHSTSTSLQSSSIPETNTQNSTSTTSSSLAPSTSNSGSGGGGSGSSSSNKPASTLYSTNSKRCVYVGFNVNDTVTSIGISLS